MDRSLGKVPRGAGKDQGGVAPLHKPGHQVLAHKARPANNQNPHPKRPKALFVPLCP
ncbi:hypothetical protein YIM73052_11290 [Thermus antranikianii]